jgi:hypothetical protein
LLDLVGCDAAIGVAAHCCSIAKAAQAAPSVGAERLTGNLR